MNALTAQLYPSLLRQAALLLSGSTAAQALQPADLLHMAVEKLYRHPPAHIETPQFPGLVRTIMQRALIDEQRRASAARRPDLAMAAPLEEAWNVAAESSAQTYGDLHEALAQLADRNADAAGLLRRHFFEGHSGVEIAAELQRSTGSVSRRLSSAILALRDVLLEEAA